MEKKSAAGSAILPLSVQVPVSAEVGREVVDIVTDVGKGAVAGPGTTVVPGSTPGS